MGRKKNWDKKTTKTKQKMGKRNLSTQKKSVQIENKLKNGWYGMWKDGIPEVLFRDFSFIFFVIYFFVILFVWCWHLLNALLLFTDTAFIQCSLVTFFPDLLYFIVFFVSCLFPKYSFLHQSKNNRQTA